MNNETNTLVSVNICSLFKMSKYINVQMIALKTCIHENE